MTRKPIFYLIISLFIILSPAFVFGDPSLDIPVDTLPTGGQVVGGSATFDRPTSGVLNITTSSDRTAIDWATFSVGANAIVNFFQPSAAAITLNRVIGTDSSSIIGKVWSNGGVGLSNPNGITIGADASINAASMFISTLNVSVEDFMNMDSSTNVYKFYKEAGKNGSIVNMGRITAQPGGYIVLLSQAIDNRGSIEASTGRIILAAGEMMTVSLDDKSQISVAIDKGVEKNIFGTNSAIKNSGSILAEGGKITLTAKILNKVFDYAINNTGIIEAYALVNNNGVVELIAEGAPILNSGRIEAGAIKIDVKDSDFINRSFLSGPDIDIKVANLILEVGKKITAENLIKIDADTILEVVYAPDGTAVAAAEADVVSSGEAISAPTVEVTARKLGLSSTPVNIKTQNLYIKRIDGNIDILESLGIGTSVLMRGPPEGFGSFIYSKDANLTLEADQVTLIGSAPIHFYGNITFYNFSCTVPDKEIYFEAGKTYTFHGTFKIEGAFGQPIRLLSSERGSYWYFDPKGQIDITYAWVEDGYNLGPIEVPMTLSNNNGGTYNWDAAVSWVGGSGSNWNTGANWSTGSTPGASDDVTIGSGYTVVLNTSPTIASLTVSGTLTMGNNTTARTLTVNNNVAINSGGIIQPNNPSSTTTHNLIIKGNFSNSGTFTSVNGNGRISVTFNGTGAQSISGSSTTAFRNLTISNTSAAGVSANSNFSISGTMTINPGAKFTVNSGVTLSNSGTVTNNGTLSFAANSVYQHNRNGGTIPTATWNAASTVEVTGVTSTVPSGLAQSFGNFTWNCASQSAGITTSTNLTTINGNFTVTNTAGRILRASASSNVTLNIGGNFVINGASARYTMVNGSGTKTVNVAGSFSMSAGTLELNGSSGTNTATLNVAGNFSHTGGTITELGSGTSTIVFNGSGTQTYTSGGTVSNTVNFTVSSGATLAMAGGSTVTVNSGATMTVNGTFDCGTGTAVSGAGTFTLASGATLRIGSTAGITSSGATGNIQTTTRNFNTGANYTYNGTATQVTGNGLPTTINNLTINNSAGVTLSQSITLNGILILTNGKLKLTVTAVTNTRTYDGTNSSSGVPTITSGNLLVGDTATWTQTFDNKNAGTGKTLTPAGTVSDGNGGNNYDVTFINDTTGVITAKPITVTAATDTKVYDGNTTSAGVPTITSGSLVGGDTATWTQTFDSRNVGPGKTLTPAGIVSDGNGGNNYAVTFVNDTTGVITAKTLTVTGITADNKVYDGTTNAALNTGAAALNGIVGADTVTLNTASAVGTFDNADIGTGKTVTISGLTISGAASGNYSLTQPTTTADITTPVVPPAATTALLTDITNQLSFMGAPRFPLPGAGELFTYQLNTFSPAVGPVYFYHPLTPYDMSAFDAMILDANAYQFVNGSINLVGHAGLLSLFEDIKKH